MLYISYLVKKPKNLQAIFVYIYKYHSPFNYLFICINFIQNELNK